MTIRLITRHDYERYAELVRAAYDSDVQATEIVDFDTNHAPNELIQRYMVWQDEQIVAAGILYYPNTYNVPRFHIWLVVDEPFRKLGIGKALYKYLEAEAIRQGATQLWGECREVWGTAFAQKQGFGIEAHLYESFLDLTQFDEKPFLPAIAHAQGLGISFTTLAQEGNHKTNQVKLFEVRRESVGDEPANDGVFEDSFENFKLEMLDKTPPEGVFIAKAGEDYLGLAFVRLNGEKAENGYLGVLKAHRGKKIARSLKLLGLRYAKERGAKQIWTNNDSRNAPMLDINQGMGYQREAGVYFMMKRVQE
jgi:GNAT superfamily N-acetyltransferase